MSIYFPTRIEFGSKASHMAGDIFRAAGCRRVMIVTDSGVLNAGLLEPLQSGLKNAHVDFIVYDGVVPDPDEACVQKGRDVYKQNECDGLLAVGGGSSIDTAKAIGVVATNPGALLDYEGVNRVENAIPYLVVVPTTCGTGSEVTNVTVITDDDHYKTPILSPYLIPKAALLDPDLLLTLPAKVVAATGMDALTHAIESYTNTVENWYAEAVAVQAMKMIGESIRPAVVNRDAQSLANMLYASTLAGVAFTLTRLGLVHAMSHPISGFAHVPHGVANAVLLPYVAAFNMVGNAKGYAEVAYALGVPEQGSAIAAAEAGVKELVRMNQHLGIPDSFKNLGVTVEMFPDMIRHTFRSGNIAINPRRVSEEDVRAIYTQSYEGNLPL
ncbi:iron-containing alcohol dehydrogenase [Alicyclobacillus tolerans]|uniref:iron-containing alcohol dehydrogenase family protein n=1 Tax=Alicyclobacillus tolerans TaxID=90970 RepID=UPI001F18EA0C|nr:iron-containing alcohol dehydrogenase [Alicyclobacillus tolerans]MCF8567116.1 iron-containing alcohol dehydrogenase [Alicyclobacillus tolerans]